jgi:hypothetical protein
LDLKRGLKGLRLRKICEGRRQVLLQELIELHHEKTCEVREDYLEHLYAIEDRGEYEEFTNIEELRIRIEDKGFDFSLSNAPLPS